MAEHNLEGDGALPEPGAPISRSLAPLRDVVASLAAAGSGQLPSATERRKLVRRVQAAGSAALPALLRALCSGSLGEGQWAAWLLLRVSSEERPRVAERISRMMEDPRLSEEQRGRVHALLGNLHGPFSAVARGADEAPVPAGAPPATEAPHVSAAFRDAYEGDDPHVPVERPEPPEAPGLDEADLGLLRSVDASLPGGSVETPAGPPRRINRRPDARRRGVDLLERGEVARAHAALSRAVVRHPDDSEVLSYLGVCLLQMGEPHQALLHLERVATLEPDEALHHWNIGAAAKAASRMCRGYLALRRYLSLSDQYEGHAGRRSEARRFLRSYEALIATMHPGVHLDVVLRGEQMFADAFADLTAKRFDAAVRGFRAVVALLPHHYPSWGNLGAAELALGRHVEAELCLRRALDLKPDYDVARDNLRLLEAPR